MDGVIQPSNNWCLMFNLSQRIDKHVWEFVMQSSCVFLSCSVTIGLKGTLPWHSKSIEYCGVLIVCQTLLAQFEFKINDPLTLVSMMQSLYFSTPPPPSPAMLPCKNYNIWSYLVKGWITLLVSTVNYDPLDVAAKQFFLYTR